MNTLVKRNNLKKVLFMFLVFTLLVGLVPMTSTKSFAQTTVSVIDYTVKTEVWFVGLGWTSIGTQTYYKDITYNQYYYLQNTTTTVSTVPVIMYRYTTTKYNYIIN